jgi:hypothetical protein
MRLRSALASVLVLVCLGLLPTSVEAKSKLRIRPGGYAQKASEVTGHAGPNFEYSNGAVNLQVARNAKTITFAGVACNIGPESKEGLEGYDEIDIRVPKHIPIRSSGFFSWSGQVTLTPEDTQSEETLTTTYTIKGRFQNGKIAVTGTDSSPLCEPSTVTHFRLIYDRSA